MARIVYSMMVSLDGGKPYFQSGLWLTLMPLGTESLPQGVTLLRYAPATCGVPSVSGP